MCMSMEQVGTEKKVSLVEAGHLVTGGSMEETVDKAETVIITNT